MFEENGIMEQKDVGHEGAMNLSLSNKENRSLTPNGELLAENGDAMPHLSPQSQKSASKRKIKSLLELPAPPQQTQQTAAVQQTQHMMMGGHQAALTPQQMQLLLQQQVLSPQQLQQMMQQQHMLLQQHSQQKLQEQVLQQLNEQLQINVLQQSQLMQQQASAAAGDKKHNAKQLQAQLQQLALQQQQLVQQLQLQQRQYLMAQGLGLQQFAGIPQGMTPSEIQQLWKEVSEQSGEKSLSNGVTPGNNVSSVAHTPIIQAPAPVSNGIPEGFMLTASGLVGPMPGVVNIKPDDSASSPPESHSLYGHGVCKWPGCETPCEDYKNFIKHITSEHHLDDRSTAQARVQMQVVNQLELQLSKERERLQAMMEHLHMKPHPDGPKPEPPSVNNRVNSPPHLPKIQPPAPVTPVTSLAPPISAPVALVSSPTPPVPMTPAVSCMNSLNSMNSLTSSATSHIASKPSSPQSHQHNSNHSNSSAPGPIRRRVSDKCNLPISAEIQRNRDFYKTTDVRPPFTYASLIRQAIIESTDRQLTLNEIYQWFQNTFAFFRKNQATWKNAVRHNLSLHKCFMRVENVKGAVWTVDEVEFYKRRPQKMSGNMSLKSPTMSPTLYGESLNASLRAALAESNLPMLNHAGAYMDGAEDLSMSRQMSEDMEGDEDYRDEADDDMGASDLSIHIREESRDEAERASDDSVPQHQPVSPPPQPQPQQLSQQQLQENSFQQQHQQLSQQLQQQEQQQQQQNLQLSRQDNDASPDVDNMETTSLHIKAKLGQEFPNHAAGLQHAEIRGARVDARMDVPTTGPSAVTTTTAAEKHELLSSMMSSIEHMQQHLQQQQQAAAAAAAQQHAAVLAQQQQQQAAAEMAASSHTPDSLHSIAATEK